MFTLYSKNYKNCFYVFNYSYVEIWALYVKYVTEMKLFFLFKLIVAVAVQSAMLHFISNVIPVFYQNVQGASGLQKEVTH